MTTALDESKYPEDIATLDLTEEVKTAGLVNYFISSFKSKSVILVLNQNGLTNLVESPVIVEDWEQTNKNFEDILQSKGVAEDARTRLLRLLNSNANRIADHFIERQKCTMHAGMKAKVERIEKAKNTPPIDVSISQALRMHEGNVRTRGMISTNSDKIEKMITRVYYRCGECDTVNELANYRETRPRFVYEIPYFDLREKKCKMGCESYRHERYEEVINAYRIELQDTETFNDLERLPVILLDNCTNKVSIGQQAVVTGSIQRVKKRGRLLTCVLVGMDSNSTIEYESKKESEELTEADIQKFQKIAKSTRKVKDKITGKQVEVNAVIDTLVSKLATSAIGLEHVKKGILFAAANSGKDTYERKLRINVLLIGETGLNKSPLLRASTKLVNNSRFISSLNSSIKSQVGIVDKEDDGYVLRLGPIPRAAGAICAIDEIGRMIPEDQEQLLHALQEGKMPFIKHGFDLMLDGRATFIMSANPKNPSGNWKDKEKIDLNEIPLLGPLRDRVDLIFVFRTNRDAEYVANYAFRKADIINNIEEKNAEEEKNYEDLRKYILYCKRFEPTLSEEAKVMIAQYYTNIMTGPQSYHSPRLFDTLSSLCYVLARIKQKNQIDVDDVNDVMEFYNEQLLHLSKLVSIPRNPCELAYEEIVNSFKGSAFKHEFIECVKTVQKKNIFLRVYIGEDYRVSHNRHLREIRDRFVKFEDNRILIISLSPLTLAWMDSYKGGETSISIRNQEDKNNDNKKEEDSTVKESENDTSDTSDGDTIDTNWRNEVPPRPLVPITTGDEDMESCVIPVIPVIPVTPQKVATTTVSNSSSKPAYTNMVDQNSPCNAVLLLSVKEKERCKQTNLTDEQVNVFYQAFNELEYASNHGYPGSYSSNDKGTVGGEELRLRIVSSDNFTADDANWIVDEIQRVGNIKKEAFDTFKRTSE